MKHFILTILILFCGCGSPTLHLLFNDILPHESVLIQGPDWCDEEFIYMNEDGYSINCNSENNEIFYSYNVNILRKDHVVYIDLNKNGIVDKVVINNVAFDVPEGSNVLQGVYRTMCIELQQLEIQRIWRRRWGR